MAYCCIYGDICREYFDRFGNILSRTCPNGCRFFRDQHEEDLREREARNIIWENGYLTGRGEGYDRAKTSYYRAMRG